MANAAHPKTLWDIAYNRGGNKPSASMNALRTMANAHTLECYASYADLAEWTGQRRATCVDQMNAAQAAGWVKLISSGHGGQAGASRSNVWRLTYPVGTENVPTDDENRFSVGTETESLQGEPKGDPQGDPFKEELVGTENVPTVGSQDSPRGEAHLSATRPSPAGVKVKESVPPYENRTNAAVFTPDDDEAAAILAEHYAAQDTPQQRLLNAITAAGGSLPAKSGEVGAAIGHDDDIVWQMIHDGLIVHDTSGDRAVLTLP